MSNKRANVEHVRHWIKPALCLCGLWLVLSACEQNAEKNPPQEEIIENSQPLVEGKKAVSVENNEISAGFVPTANDMENLAAAMGGAKNQQPADAPKDKYGRPNIIGNLGGFPVNLPSSVVGYVEYEDSPGWDPEALRNYHPSVRSYDSVFTSFGFDFRNSINELYDRNNDEMYELYNKKPEYSVSRDEGDWIHVGVQSGSRKGKPGGLDRMLAANVDKEYSGIPWDYWVSTGEFQFGLERYIQPEASPKTGKKWRDEDLFIFQDEEGKVQAYIECSTAENSAYPSCTHEFNFPPPMQVDIRLWYHRHQLSHWREIEAHTIQFISDFRADKSNGETK